MAIDPARDGYLRLIEGKSDIAGRYVNLKRVGANGGEGHFSLVFSATDKQTGRTVAIKVFRPDRLTDTYRFQCFCREVILLEGLTGNANILEWLGPRNEFVENVQTGTGICFDLTFPYYVVELAATDAAELIRSGNWKPEEKLAAFRCMCKGVQRIHRREIVHRDVKPSNFLIMLDKDVKLSDFGAARKIDGTESAILTSYPAAPGDSRYTSPEMHALLHDDDPGLAKQGDIFALGATLFEMFSGVVLGIQLFDASFAADLAGSMGAVQKRDRKRIYLQFVQSLDAGHPLPSISEYANDTPPCIRGLVDNLYKAIARLDYQRRLCDFETIFLKIDQCLLVLRNEEKVRRWKEQREQRSRNHELKMAHRESKRMLTLGAKQ
jgi:serine/threonine protein kinase